MTEKLYGHRDPRIQDHTGDFYSKHVMAMTAEGLHSKSDIAMELAHRDILIDDLQHQLKGMDLVANIGRKAVEDVNDLVVEQKSLRDEIKQLSEELNECHVLCDQLKRETKL